MDARKLIDPELLDAANFYPEQTITRENLAGIKVEAEKMMAEAEKPELNVEVKSRTFVGRSGVEVKVLVFQPRQPIQNKPGLLWIHGGGYILGIADDTISAVLAEKMQCTVVSVDYRLAPEHPFPAGPEDCHDALIWMHENAAELGVDTQRIAIGGQSAGAGMAAGVALMNRDQQGPQLAFQFLLYPMLDNLHDTPSGQLENHPVWNRQTSLNAWEMYLNAVPGEEASPYAAAMRADDLSNLPPAYVVVGTQDLFRDECINYAQRLMAADVPTELAVFPGVFHGAESFVPTANIAQRMNENIMSAFGRILG